MTKENLKKLLEHYKSIGRDEAVADILKKYPELREVREEPKEEVKDKSKGKK